MRGEAIFDPEENLFCGVVTGITDVVDFQGENNTEVRKAFEDSVDDYLDFCQERGENPCNPSG